jgi:hypothetical protein
MARKFTLQYPLQIGAQGLKRDETSRSRLRILSTVVVRQFVLNPEYGFPPFQFEQGSLEPDAEQLLIIFFTQQAIQRWVPSVALAGTNVKKDEENRRKILEILFMDRAGVDPRAKQLLPVGLDFLSDG